ncbi:hypothetical protein TWF569_006654 [Orbilia oligospora]|uniref:NAD(P)-binding protein n=1 Tax=Orbilia oligospora TaxID=2813651 RepID=A0A7C8J7N1_ORBOL|nr:hypothetical protein TWF102_005304 [Orbilia oligospora]KAF3111678.1 hypothetical protein TWF706_011421 [Orbilia oligospora]KAF3140030.1 hypothetical protein TWF594_006425 [Orbilia oligospora]KAF3145024.1 hypothetical protein TWF569_006654 [Orbilia oligospora]
MTNVPTVILTGAGRGIGHAILVHLLGLPNPPNILAVSRNIQSLESLAKSHKNLEAVSVDFSPSSGAKPKAGETIIGRATSRWGRVDSIILNHGTLDPVAKIEDADLEGWATTFQVNFFSNVDLIRNALPELRKSSGRVVMVSSGAVGLPFTGWGAYGSSKAALNHLNMTLAHEEPAISSIAIAPGIVDTDMQKALRDVHGDVMPHLEQSLFINLKESGQIVKPSDVGTVLGNLSLNMEKSLSGKYLNWDDTILASYRGH